MGNLRFYLLALLGSATSPVLATARQRRPVTPTWWETALLVIVPVLIFWWFSIRYGQLCQEMPVVLEGDSVQTCETAPTSLEHMEGDCA